MSYIIRIIEGLCERTEHLSIFLFFCPSLICVLFPMFCLLVKGECQILVFYSIIRPASVAQWAEAQCAPAGTVCWRGGVQSPGRPADFVFGFQGRML